MYELHCRMYSQLLGPRQRDLMVRCHEALYCPLPRPYLTIAHPAVTAVELTAMPRPARPPQLHVPSNNKSQIYNIAYNQR